MLTTEGIVLRTVKYGETSLIMDIFTKEKGLLSGIAGGVRKSKSSMPASHFQLLQPLQIVMYYKPNDQLNRIKEVRPLHVLLNVHTHPIKRTYLIFLAELFQKALKEKEPNPQLYAFMSELILQLEEQSELTNDFHLRSMLRLTQFLGFYPSNNYSTSLTFFHLLDGQFQNAYDPRHTLDPEDSQDWNNLMRSTETSLSLRLEKKQREILLQNLIRYYSYHIPGFDGMKSPSILHSILN